MARIAALGPTEAVQGFALAGALVLPAADAGAFDRAFDALPDDVGVLVLTANAAHALQGRLPERPRLLPVVIPE